MRFDGVGVPETRRILSKVSVGDETDCWPWQATLHPREGYGQVQFRGRPTPAHRAVFLLLGGRIPEGLEMDHLCRNRRCVNPQHLDAVTRKENIARSPIMWSALRAMSSTCPNGHSYTPDNTRSIAVRGRSVRRCLTCYRLRRAQDNVVRRRRRAQVRREAAV